jgi:type I site-specific restriction-modification system R (restriction) subunit
MPGGTYAPSSPQPPLSPASSNPLETLLNGIFHPDRYLDLIRYFTVFESDGETLTKKMAGYHQYYAVNKAVEATLRATSVRATSGRRGDLAHPGSGKSLSMTFYAGKIIQHPQMANPTLVVLTDRNDLDEQLYTTFSKCQDLLRQTPQQAEIGPTSKPSSRSPPAASSSPPFRNLPPMNGAASTRPSPIAATSSSSPMRPTAPNTASKPAW